MLNNYHINVKATIAFLRLLNVKVNSATVNETLQSHPDWPSLLSISDSLNKWHVSNAAGNVDKNNIEQLPTPFLAHLNDLQKPLCIVTGVSQSSIDVYNINERSITKSDKDSFLSKWDGVCLIAEASEHSGEENYLKIKRKSLINALTPIAALLSLILLSLVLVGESVGRIALPTTISVSIVFLQFFVYLAGVGVTLLLLWYELDRNNPVLKRFCTGLTKSNCEAILSSKQAKIFNWLSWSEVGFFYFTGCISMLIFANDVSFITNIGWLNIFATPYICYSLYYQWKVARQWCPLCLIVQLLLLIGTVDAILGNLLQPISLNSFQPSFFKLLLYLLPATLWFSLKPYILRLQKEKNITREYLRIKFNAEIFETLLKKQKALTLSPQGLGIELGNVNASVEVIKVCNPYCGPCGQIHPGIEKLLEAVPNLKVKIIFTSFFNGAEHYSKPIKHFLAIHEFHQSQEVTKQALNDWYLSKSKDYQAFASKYPFNKELARHDNHVKAMHHWCKEAGVTATPTLFVNGHKLPSEYSVEDLKYFLLD
jgi:uncharacterized membrane protein